MENMFQPNRTEGSRLKSEVTVGRMKKKKLKKTDGREDKRNIKRGGKKYTRVDRD